MSAYGTGIVSSRGQVTILPRILIPTDFVFAAGIEVQIDLFEVDPASHIYIPGTVDANGNSIGLPLVLFDISHDEGLESNVQPQTPAVDTTFDLFKLATPTWFGYLDTNISLELFTVAGFVLPPTISVNAELPLFAMDPTPMAYGSVQFELFTLVSASIGEYRARGDIQLELFTVEGSVLRGVPVINAAIDLVLFEVYREITADIKLPLFDVVNTYAINYKTGVAWCSNLRFDDGPETTEFTNFGFLHILRLGNDYYGVKNDGFYRLGGTSDEGGIPIQSVLELAPNTLNDLHRKRCAYVYLNGDSSVTLTAKVDGISSPTYVNTDSSDRKVKLGRALAGVTWGFTLTNISQGVLKINGLEPMFEPLSRKVP
jgi:hypothetical protein